MMSRIPSQHANQDSKRGSKIETKSFGKTLSFGKSFKRVDERAETEVALPKSNKWQGHDRLSKKFDNLKTGDPFGSKRRKHETNFSFVYSQGGIPCRINHGGVISRLQWDEDPQNLYYDPLLVTVSEGLRETSHPFVFVAQNAFKELLEQDGACEKTIPLLPQIVRNLRCAMLTPNDDIFLAALHAIQQLSNCVQEALNPHMGAILIQINKKAFERKFKSSIFETLMALDQNGGPEAAKVIKGKVPCFSYQ